LEGTIKKEVEKCNIKLKKEQCTRKSLRKSLKIAFLLYSGVKKLNPSITEHYAFSAAATETHGG